MRNWWKSLSEPKRAVLAIVLIMMGLVIGMLVITYEQTTNGRITFDSAKQEIRPKLSFGEWLADWLGPGERYIIIPEEILFVDIVNNVAYRAELRLPKNSESVKKFLTEEMLNPRLPLNDLKKSIERCVDQINPNAYIIGQAPIIVRAMSISNMNQLCPVANRFGYEWFNKLEIVQCHGDLPLDNAHRNDCLNSARLANYP